MDKMSATEMLEGLGLIAAIAFMFNMFVSFLLYRFVALNSPPLGFLASKPYQCRSLGPLPL